MPKHNWHWRAFVTQCSSLLIVLSHAPPALPSPSPGTRCLLVMWILPEERLCSYYLLLPPKCHKVYNTVISSLKTLKAGWKPSWFVKCLSHRNEGPGFNPNTHRKIQAWWHAPRMLAWGGGGGDRQLAGVHWSARLVSKLQVH